MGRSVKEGMRPLMPAENQELQRIVQATSERVDTVRRATALLSVAAGKSRTAAGQEAQLSRQAVTQVIKRFNQGGLAALSIAAGRGRQLTSTRKPQARIVDARAAGAGSPSRPDGDVVADDTAPGSPQGGAALHRQGNHPPGGACSGLELPVHAHWVPHRLRAAPAQERHRDGVGSPNAGKKEADRAGLRTGRSRWECAPQPG